MATQGENNTKLGAFVLAGLLVLILSFYMIGKNHNLFGSNFEIKARFSNLNGLIEGNNVLFSGLQAGSVKNIEIVNDTTIEVTLSIANKLKPFIHKNAMASIGTEGLMGNKVVNILPVKNMGPLVQDGDLLPAQKMINTDEMLQTLSKTNNNIAVITEALKGTVLRIDSSALLALFNDKNIGASLKSSLGNINQTTVNAKEMTHDLKGIIEQIKKGKGAAGVLLSDTSFAGNLKQAMAKIQSASDNANQITVRLNTLVAGINQELNNGKGPLNVLLKDTLFAKNLRMSMDNVQKGTDGFNQDMEALKHNFLLRGYFKNLEKKQQKEKEKSNESGL